ncbi:hypothetical protein [Natronorubrum daqingense]|uniref:Uncharacterized protein n=1 Tax=Natronorubrum daqingense TaxID=588898 RepID=A0A1N7DVK5_9EURY|nr:hypothetical protein [Natronorubrum daqingense]APX96202.1 hypothetical protein BB347_05945 [Natronorubrum daqingense]SIR79864.1 hypothetical protein SAMN05421809_2271 [Natronorubrum daqingense]
MNRRGVLLGSVSLVGVPGCVDNLSEGTSDTGSEGDSDDFDEDYSRAEGTTMVEVDVDSDFDETVALETDCRTERFKIDSEEEFGVQREEDAESCSFEICIDGETAYEGSVGGPDFYQVEVTENGEIRSAVDTI